MDTAELPPGPAVSETDEEVNVVPCTMTTMEVLYRGASFELSELKKHSSRDWGFWLLESCQTSQY